MKCRHGHIDKCQFGCPRTSVIIRSLVGLGLTVTAGGCFITLSVVPFEVGGVSNVTIDKAVTNTDSPL